MLKRIQRLVTSWYGAFMERVAGSDSAGEQDAEAGVSETGPEATGSGEPTEEELQRRYEKLESRRLVEEIRRGERGGPPPAPEGPVEKTIGPASPPPGSPGAPEPPVEKTIGPKQPPDRR